VVGKRVIQYGMPMEERLVATRLGGTTYQGGMHHRCIALMFTAPDVASVGVYVR
jgi:hypothetical protein